VVDGIQRIYDVDGTQRTYDGGWDPTGIVQKVATASDESSNAWI
jgi:hypothetical protein